MHKKHDGVAVVRWPDRAIFSPSAPKRGMTMTVRWMTVSTTRLNPPDATRTRRSTAWPSLWSDRTGRCICPSFFVPKRDLTVNVGRDLSVSIVRLRHSATNQDIGLPSPCGCMHRQYNSFRRIYCPDGGGDGTSSPLHNVRVVLRQRLKMETICLSMDFCPHLDDYVQLLSAPRRYNQRHWLGIIPL